jgi:tetratricopeptide (TPR) repeat protein
MPRTALALGLLALAAALTLPYLPTWYHMEAGGRALQAAQTYAAAHPAQPNAALDRALHHFERAAQRAPGNGYAYRRLGQAWLLAGNNDAARQALLRAAELRPDHPLIWIELGRAYDGLGQVQKALEAYEQGGYGPAVEAAIANYLKAADWQAAGGARRAALDVIETRILALDPDNLPALVRALDLTRALGETEREAELRQQVRELRPGQMTPPAEPRLAAYTADAVQRLVDEGLWRQGQADKYGAQ